MTLLCTLTQGMLPVPAAAAAAAHGYCAQPQPISQASAETTKPPPPPPPPPGPWRSWAGPEAREAWLMKTPVLFGSAPGARTWWQRADPTGF